MGNSATQLRRLKILFVCLGNTCRSVMAEGLARQKFGDTIEVASAGIRPQKRDDAAMAIDILRLFKIDMSQHIARHINSVNMASFDRVIALDKQIAKQLVDIPADKLIIWEILDPWGVDEARYEKCALEIKREIAMLNNTISKDQKGFEREGNVN